jgi:hypothetical protein
LALLRLVPGVIGILLKQGVDCLGLSGGETVGQRLEHLINGVGVGIHAQVLAFGAGLHRFLEQFFKAGQGLLGGYLALLPGFDQPGGPLADGDTIATTIDEADINDIIKDLSVISASIKDVIGDPETKEDLKKIVSNMEDSSANLSDITARINRGEGSLGKLMNDDRLYDDMKNVTEKISKGEGTLGKLVQDDSLYTETENTMREFRKAAEGIEEQTPISVMSTIFGLIF